MTSVDDEDLVLSASEDVHDVERYVLAIVNALIEMLKSSDQITSDSKEADTNSEDSKVHWPPNEDVPCLLDCGTVYGIQTCCIFLD